MITAKVVAQGLVNLPDMVRRSLAKGMDIMSMVWGFHLLFKVPYQPLGSPDEKFTHMDDPRVALRLGFIMSEIEELFQDGFDIELEWYCKVKDRFNPGNELRTSDIREALAHSQFRDGEQVADASADITYFIYGMNLEMGYDLPAVMEEVHASNLTKAGADGQPIINGVTEGFREGEDGFDDRAGTGKVLKGPFYVKPNIRAALGWPAASITYRL